MKRCLLQHLRKLPLDSADTVGCCPFLLNCAKRAICRCEKSCSAASDSQATACGSLGWDISATGFRIKEKKKKRRIITGQNIEINAVVSGLFKLNYLGINGGLKVWSSLKVRLLAPPPRCRQLFWKMTAKQRPSSMLFGQAALPSWQDTSFSKRLSFGGWWFPDCLPSDRCFDMSRIRPDLDLLGWAVEISAPGERKGAPAWEGSNQRTGHCLSRFTG